MGNILEFQRTGKTAKPKRDHGPKTPNSVEPGELIAFPKLGLKALRQTGQPGDTRT